MSKTIRNKSVIMRDGIIPITKEVNEICLDQENGEKYDVYLNGFYCLLKIKYIVEFF